MDYLAPRQAILVVTLSLMACIQGSPVPNTVSNADAQPGSGSNPTPLITDFAVNPVSDKNIDSTRKHDVMESKMNAKTIPDGDVASNADGDIESSLQELAPSRPLGDLTSGTPFLESALLAKGDTSKEADVDTLGSVTKQFTKKVLSAFFDELKRRPDLVDEILKRETYRLLMSTVLEDNDFSLLPEDGLTQDLLTVADIEPMPDADQGRVVLVAKPDADSAVGRLDVGQISKKSSQNSPPKQNTLVGSANEAQAPLVVSGSKGGSEQTDGGSSTANKGRATNEFLLAPYYYYVYYDENEDPSSTGADKMNEKSQLEVNPSKTPTNDVNSGSSSILEQPKNQEKDEGSKAEKSVIARDMEYQLANSKLAQKDNEAPKIPPLKGENTPTKEEMQLSKLAA